MRSSFIVVTLLLSCVVVAPALAQPQNVRVVWTKDPAHRATVLWTSHSASAGTLAWGVSPQATVKDYGQQASSTGMRPDDELPHYIHQATMTGLPPGDEVYFRVVADAAPSPTLWFRTAPDDATPFTLLAGGDSRSDSRMRRIVNAQMRDLVADNRSVLALAHGGDFVATGASWAQWRRWLNDWQVTTGKDGRVLPIIPTRGNHEGNGKLYNEVFGQPGDPTARGDWWVTRIGQDFALVTLDSNYSLAGVQREWLAATLKALQDTRWIAAQYHRPAYPAVKSPGDARYQWVGLFEQYNVDFVLESDGHVLKRTVPIRDDAYDPTGVVYLGEGGLGVPQRTPDLDRWYLQPPGMAASSHHIQLLNVTRDKIFYRAIDESGELLDEYVFEPKRLGRGGPSAATFRALPVGPPAAPKQPPLFRCATTSQRCDLPPGLLLLLALCFGRRRRLDG